MCLLCAVDDWHSQVCCIKEEVAQLVMNSEGDSIGRTGGGLISLASLSWNFGAGCDAYLFWLHRLCSLAGLHLKHFFCVRLVSVGNKECTWIHLCDKRLHIKRILLRVREHVSFAHRTHSPRIPARNFWTIHQPVTLQASSRHSGLPLHLTTICSQQRMEWFIVSYLSSVDLFSVCQHASCWVASVVPITDLPPVVSARPVPTPPQPPVPAASAISPVQQTVQPASSDTGSLFDGLSFETEPVHMPPESKIPQADAPAAPDVPGVLGRWAHVWLSCHWETIAGFKRFQLVQRRYCSETWSRNGSVCWSRTRVSNRSRSW